MEEVILDPNADAILILPVRKHEFAPWNEEKEFPRPPFVLPPVDEDIQIDTAMQINEDEADTMDEDLDADDDDDEEKEDDAKKIHFHVSSRHLILASLYFRGLLGEEWGTHPRDEKGRFILEELTEWGAETFGILLCIIHGKARRVPRSLDLAAIAEIASMVDYYQCEEVVEVYFTYWMDNLEEAMSTNYGRSTVLWLWISWVFRDEMKFRITTYVMIRNCRAGMQDLGLPIPDQVLSTCHDILSICLFGMS
ncbi:hypothetical protein BDV95DRAFT_594042 [Massariosphaeria phaeospora]|uniref:BTB domain-containing protein n=1 Tax=Massariosphaeria phaeospora TaxID=100035 RepID=A0A7C8I9L8_9PLEO|nr:hypothetical protein BDV95DRAFT_594042 [Massariosphaeria phaeospora]